ncbi:MAG: sugar nucleotide-binding protein [Proteobacteria bacterium]|nr:sugar nucleotide-binding protein [Pseudomonadota bacterium]MDA0993526.1 sugar nucleotide-binding protein [Pseudomonadota bacterium]
MQILLTGGSGMLGTELLALNAGLTAPSRDEVDITNAAVVAAYIAKHKPDIILHAAAVTANRDIEASPASALDVNIQGTVNLARACLDTRTRLVFLSTDYVYKGDRGNYSESDELLPSNLYAWTKLAGEAAVRAVPNHLIIRTSFGSSQFDYPAAFADKWSSKEYVDIIAPEILLAARSPLTGVVNIGGPKRRIFEYAKVRNPGVASIERGQSAHSSPADTSLDLTRWSEYKQGRGIVRAVTSCRVCGGAALEKYLDLGMMPLANNLAPTANEAKSMQRFPMQVQYCRDCSLSQLTVVIDPREMFSHYTYRSSVNKGYVRHCRSMAESVQQFLGLVPGDLVVDIAGNDGALLREFKDALGVDVLNVDPAENISAIAKARGIPTINEFWSVEVARRILDEYQRPKLITATNVFAHVDDVRGFISAAKNCLAEVGALMLEFPYGVDFIEHHEFDTIYFEHLSYVLIEPVRRLAALSGMEVFNVEKQDIHGGSVRVFIGIAGNHEINTSVKKFIDAEKADGYHDDKKYLNWNCEVDDLISNLSRELCKLKAEGAKIAAFAASAKGNTLLNACGLDSNTIDYIVDDTPEKIGRFSPGNGIPIVDRSVLEKDPPDYLLILAWNFAREIIAGTSQFSDQGGQYIIPIPSFGIVKN